jgi:hypothetical protein
MSILSRPERLTKEQYLEAIENLKLGMTQLEPDGHCCAICSDSDHFAWGCHHNPLAMSQEVWKLRADLEYILPGSSDGPIGVIMRNL